VHCLSHQTDRLQSRRFPACLSGAHWIAGGLVASRSIAMNGSALNTWRSYGEIDSACNNASIALGNRRCTLVRDETNAFCLLPIWDNWKLSAVLSHDALRGLGSSAALEELEIHLYESRDVTLSHLQGCLVG